MSQNLGETDMGDLILRKQQLLELILFRLQSLELTNLIDPDGLNF